MKKLVLVLIVLLMMVVGCTSQPASTLTPVPPTGTPQPTSTSVPVPPTNAPTSTSVAPAPAYAVEVIKDIEYTTPLQPGVPTQKLDVFAPGGPGPWPVVLFLGGINKDTMAFASLGTELAGHGVLVFAPNWRVFMAVEAAKNDGSLIRESSEELSCAVRFARERAADYGGDPSRITVFSYAAGGQGIAKALVGDDAQAWEQFASRRGGPPAQADCVADGAPVSVDALVVYSGHYTDLEVLKEQNPELWDLCSPFASIGKNPNLVVHLVHGDQDQAVSVARAAEFQKALLEAGYQATLTVVNSEHQLPWSGPAREELIRVIVEAARR